MRGDPAEPAWNDDGLIPAIVQDAATGRVRMLAWMNREALSLTRSTGWVHFFSRSRQKLWQKGETSGNGLRVVSLAADCDADALLVRAVPIGPTCHTGAVSCFFRELDAAGDPEPAQPDRVLERLAAIVKSRAAERPDGSYTAKLLAAGTRRIAQKVGEEGVETALAGAAGDDDELVSEAADLLYHVLVLFESRQVPPARLAAELARRLPGARARQGPRRR